MDYLESYSENKNTKSRYRGIFLYFLVMRNLFLLAFTIVSIISCKTKPFDDVANKEANSKVVKGDTIKIANKDVQYDVTIIDVGFSSWLNSRALPRNYYSLSYLENKNQWYVQEWNRRVLQPQRYDRNLYEMQINYDPSIRYGYEVNYLIYNYMIYFQNTYNQQLFGRVPTR